MEEILSSAAISRLRSSFKPEISIFVGPSTSLHKGRLYNSRFVPFSSCQWTLVGDQGVLQPKPTNCLSAIVVQRLVYGNAPPPATLTEEDDLEQALALAEE